MRKIIVLIVAFVAYFNLIMTPTAAAGLLVGEHKVATVSFPQTYLLAKTHSSTKSSTHHSSSQHKSSSPSKSSSHSSKHSSTSSGNCDYPEQLDSAGRRCGNRAASVRAGGRLGGSQ